METSKDNYMPTHPVHPFEILKEELEAREITQKEFALKIGMKPSNFNRLLKGKGELSSDLALKLEELLEIPAEHWMQFMIRYRRDLKRTKKTINALGHTKTFTIPSISSLFPSSQSPALLQH